MDPKNQANQPSNDTYTVTFQDGTEVDFHGQPSDHDIEHVAEQIGIKKSSSFGPTSQDIPGIATDVAMGFLPGFRELLGHPNEALGQSSSNPILNVVPPGFPRAMAASGVDGAVGLVNSLTNILNNKAGTKIPEIPQMVKEPFNANEMLPKPVTPAGHAIGMAGELGSSLLSIPAIEGLTNILKGGAKGVGEALTVGSKLDKVGKELELTNSEIANRAEQKFLATGEKGAVEAQKKEAISKLTDEFKAKKAKLESQLREETLSQSEANKPKIRNLSKSISDTYEKGLDDAEAIMEHRGDTINSVDYNEQVIQKTKQSLIEKGFPQDSPVLQKIDELGKDVGNQYTQSELNLRQVKNIRKTIYDELSSGFKTGSKYADQEDAAAVEFLKNHGKYIEKKAPELAEMNKEFAPMANSRNWAYNQFKPWSDAEIEKGAKTLEKIANGEYSDQTVLNHLDQLEKGNGRFEGTGDLRGKVPKTANELNGLKTKYDTAKQKLVEQMDQRISELSRKIEDASQSGKQGKLLSNHTDNLKGEIARLEKLKDLRNKVIVGAATILGAGAVAKGAFKANQLMSED